MTPAAGSLRQPDGEQRAALRRLMATWAGRADGVPAPPAEEVEMVDVAVLRDGRPGLLDVVALVAGRLAHAVLGLRRAGDELHVLGAVEDPVLGLVEDEHGLAVAVDALLDAESAQLLLAAVGGPDAGAAVRLDRATAGPSAHVSVVDDPEEAVLAYGDRCTLRVFPRPHPRPHPGVELLLALDEAGFNHLPAPIVVWRRHGRDLGVVQERYVGAAPGWALALGSLRDHCARGGAPEEAGGDFAPEARALGTMVARMHAAVDRAYGRRPGDVGSWVEEAESAVAHVDAAALHDEEIAGALRALRGSSVAAPSVRVHSDLHLGRTARTDQGWVLADCTPGGVRGPADDPLFRSPLADVADILWSLHHAALTTAADLGRDPFGHPAAVERSASWEARNRRAFVAGYLSSADPRLLPADRAAVRGLLALFELERDARIALRRHPSATGRRS